MSYNKKKILYLLVCIILSILSYLSFRIYLYNFFNDVSWSYDDENYFIYLYFVAFQLAIWLSFFARKKFSTICDVFLILMFVNIISTPIYFVYTKDVPILQKNLNYLVDYTEDGFFGGIIEGRQKIFTDASGFRPNKKNIDYSNKDKDTIRIFTIGASATANIRFGNEKTWSSLMGKLIKNSTNKNVEVINTGINGLRSQQFYLKLRDISKYDPDLVIIMTGINDWNHHIRKNQNFIFPNYEINYDIKKSILYNAFRNIKKTIIRKINKTKNNKIILTISKKENTQIIIEDGSTQKKQAGSLYKKDKRFFNPTDVSQNYKFWIKKIVDYCTKNNLSFDCLFLDQANSYNKDISKDLMDRFYATPADVNYTLSFDNIIHISNLYNNWIKERISVTNLFMFPISEKIPANIKYLRDDVHYTELGNNQVAKELYQFINENIDF